ncbi:hypothetical protein BJY04DRAFT_216737 [Aspergillus karnatakaensis]|uniref:uncharacterized protein n=1 Tax=Aspergillus karnatakaensis TaxID=1810916 RepID=UPI003CCD17E7
MSPTLTLLSLPLEVLLAITSTLPTQGDISALSCTCHYLHTILSEPLLSFHIKHHKSSALQYAASTGNLPLTRRLLDLGADVEATGEEDNEAQGTPLYLA